MKKFLMNSLMLLAAGVIATSCADYNETTNFSADPDPSKELPYTEYDAVKTYIDKDKYPNLTIGATLDITKFNKQELEHAAAMSNFDDLTFGKTLMSGSIISPKGIMNFISLMDLLEHMDEVGGTVFGSPLVANANQPDEWIKTLTAPIEIPVDYVEGKTVNYNDYPLGAYDGTVTAGNVSIVKYDGQNVLGLLKSGSGLQAKAASARLAEGVALEPGATYTVTFWANTAKDNASFNITFADNKVMGTATDDGKWKIPGGKWTKVSFESKAAEDATEGYVQIDMVKGQEMYVQKIEVGYFPDNHRPQTEEERNDTINYALNAWIDGFMKINEGRISTFDLIDEPIDDNTLLENEKYYDLKHSSNKDQVFWQDVLGSENYAPEVAKIARESFEKHGGDPAELKFYISETGLEDTNKMESLKYWINIWDANGAKIDGINAKVNLVYYENEEKQAANKKAYETLLASLASTGKLIRISNFDIKYVDSNNINVTAANITKEQREKLAEYNAYAIKAYMSKIPSDKQAGICKANIVDTSDPVGLWSQDSKTKDWVRSATYKAWCDALSGK